MRLKRNLFASRDKSWQRILVRFDGFWLYLFKGGVCVYFYRSSTESHFRNMRGVAGINTRISWPQSASVVVSEPHCTADVCSVNCLALMAGKPLILESGHVWSVIVHWRMIILLFTYAMWHVKAKKKRFQCSFAKYSFFEIAWKTTSCERKNFLLQPLTKLYLAHLYLIYIHTSYNPTIKNKLNSNKTHSHDSPLIFFFFVSGWNNLMKIRCWCKCFPSLTFVVHVKKCQFYDRVF